MAAITQRGYDTLGCKILAKDGTEVDEAYLKRYTCVRCALILRIAFQMVCGDRICKECFPQIAFTCPECDEEIDPSKPQQSFNDRSCQKDIRELRVVCKCGETYSIDEWEKHSDTCPDIVRDKPQTGSDQSSSENVRRLEIELKLTQSQLSDMKQQFSKSLKKSESMEKEFKKLKSTVNELQGQYSSSGATVGPSGDVQPPSGQVRRLSERYTQLNDLVTTLVADVEQQKSTVNQMSSSVDQVTQRLPRVEAVLEELNLKIEILEVKSTTGNYIWKVNDLARRRREARIGRTVSLYSPPFYTSVHGYRICLRAYLNGDGTGKDTHISLFLVIMKSEYDDLLKWPFSHKITLRLINQEYPLVPERSITHKFLPNAESGSFRKPIETFNVASGFPEFARQEVLDSSEFVRNDTIYFQVIAEPPDGTTGPDQFK